MQMVVILSQQNIVVLLRSGYIVQRYSCSESAVQRASNSANSFLTVN